MKTEIEHEIERLNKAYPSTQPLKLDVYRSSGFARWKACVKGNCDKIVFILSCKEVFGTYRYSEHLSVKLIHTEQ